MTKAEAAVKQVQAEFPNSPSTVKPIQVDIEDDTSINKAFEKVSSEYGYLDVLINNAGEIARTRKHPTDQFRGLRRHAC